MNNESANLDKRDQDTAQTQTTSLRASYNIMPYRAKYFGMLFITLLISCLQTNQSQSDSLSSYMSKTYLYTGNSFEARYNSKIDTLKYTWADSFSNGNLIKRYYPSYSQDFVRTEKYQYDPNGRLILTAVETKSKFNGYTSRDSLFTSFTSDTSHIVTKSMADDGIWKEIWTIKGDTTFMEQVINNKSAFISREYRDSQNRKHSQIVSPEKSAVENIYIYNERNDLIEIVRIEEGKSEIAMKVKYKYDKEGRIVDKETYNGESGTIGSKEITIYD